MSFQTEYQKKLITAENAAKLVKSGDWVDLGWAATHPASFDGALTELAKNSDLRDLNFRGGILCTLPQIFTLPDAKERFTWNSWHSTGIDRKIIDAGCGFYIPVRYSELPNYYLSGEATAPDIAIFAVSPMDENGKFNFGPSVSHMRAVIKAAKMVILEVNNQIPVCLGDENSVHISEVDFVIEGENPALPALSEAKISETDEKIANLIVNEIHNGSCIQLGIGGMPNAVGKIIAKSDLKHLGVHTEMYVDGFMEMSLAGKIDGSQKPIDRGLQTYTFAMGSQKLYEFLHENPNLRTTSVDKINDISVISAIDNFVSINNAVNIDLFGQVNSESAATRHISGAGGQLDFVMGAYLSKGGKSFICCSSTIQAKDGSVKSRILPLLDHGSIVTATRANIHYFVTEFGIANLKGATTWQRAERIINLAHPNFRDELIQSAEKIGIWRKSNKK